MLYPPEPVISVRDLRMRYGTHDVLEGVDFEIGPRRGRLPARPQRRRQDHHDRDPRGLPDAAPAGEVRVLGTDPARSGRGLAGAHRRRAPVVAGPPSVDAPPPAEPPRRYYAPYSTPERSRPVEGRRADRHGRPGRAGRPEDRHSVGRAAPPPRRGDRHHRPARVAVPRRADRRFRPPRPARVPRPRAPAVRPRGHDDPAHHPRPRRGGEARRPHPDPGRRPDRRRRQRRRACPPGRRQGSGQWSRGGEQFVHSTADATRFVRELFASTATRSTDLEVRRASLEDTYISMVQQHETGSRRRGRRLRGGSGAQERGRD